MRMVHTGSIFIERMNDVLPRSRSSGCYPDSVDTSGRGRPDTRPDCLGTCAISRQKLGFLYGTTPQSRGNGSYPGSTNAADQLGERDDELLYPRSEVQGLCGTFEITRDFLNEYPVYHRVAWFRKSRVIGPDSSEIAVGLISHNSFWSGFKAVCTCPTHIDVGFKIVPRESS